MKSISKRPHALALLSLWLLLTIQVAVLFFLSRPWLTSDSPSYLEDAAGLNSGCFGVVVGHTCQPEAVRPPGYAMFLWSILYGLKLPLTAVLVTHFIIYLLSIYLAQRLLSNYEINPFPFLGIMLVYPFTAAYCAKIMAEAVTVFLVAGVAYLIARRQSPTMPTLLAVGGMLGVATLVRPDLVLLPPVLALALYWRLRAEAQKAATSAMRPAALWPRAMLVVVVPWLMLLPCAYRNHRVFGTFSPLPPVSVVGNSLYVAYWHTKVPNPDLDAFARGEITPTVRSSGLLASVIKINKALGARPLTWPFNPKIYPTTGMQMRNSRLMLQEALRLIKAEPWAYLKHVGSNFWRLWNTAEYPAALPTVGKLLLGACSGLICILGYAGTIVAFWQRKYFMWQVAALIVLYFLLIHIWLHTEARYTAPARLFLVLNAVLLLNLLAQRLGRGHGIQEPEMVIKPAKSI